MKQQLNDDVIYEQGAIGYMGPIFGICAGIGRITKILKKKQPAISVDQLKGALTEVMKASQGDIEANRKDLSAQLGIHINRSISTSGRDVFFIGCHKNETTAMYLNAIGAALVRNFPIGYDAEQKNILLGKLTQKHLSKYGLSTKMDIPYPGQTNIWVYPTAQETEYGINR